MTFTESGTEQAAKKPRPMAFVRAFLFGGLWGVALTGIVVGPVIGNLWVLFTGIGLFLVAFVTFGIVEGRKQEQKGDESEPGPGLAPARIESRRAIGGESGDIPVEFVLTVARDDLPAYRVKTHQTINLVDIPGYPSGGLVVVEYHQRRPWEVRIVTEPAPEWARRLAEGAVDSAPESTLVSGPRSSPASCLLGIAGLLAGAALVVVLFRGDLFDSDASSTAAKPGASVTSSYPSSSESSSSSSTIVVTTGSTTFSSSYTLAEPGEPMLRAGEMSTAADALSAQTGSSEVTQLTITQRTMTVRGSLADGTAGAGQDPRIDLRSVRYGQLPALVGDAKTPLGVADPISWVITFGHDAAGKALVIHVSVSDDQGGSASLTADAQGHVTKRSPRAVS
jgi:hypothetical protein